MENFCFLILNIALIIARMIVLSGYKRETVDIQLRKY